MLQYLPMIASGLQLMGQRSAMKNAGKGAEQTQAERAQLQAMANRERLIQASLNPNDIIMKNLAAGESQQINNATQQGLSNLLAANRKAQLMGRQTFFNPERQDETISQFMTKATDANATTARSNALKRILDAASGYSNSASGYGNMVANQQASQNINNAKTPTQFAMGANMLKQFGQGGSMSNIFSMLSNNSGVASPNGNMAWNGGRGM